VPGKVPDIGEKRSSTGRPGSGVFGWAGVGGSRVMMERVEDVRCLDIGRGNCSERAHENLPVGGNRQLHFGGNESLPFSGDNWLDFNAY
jgi:hypothetical protein